MMFCRAWSGCAMAGPVSIVSPVERRFFLSLPAPLCRRLLEDRQPMKPGLKYAHRIRESRGKDVSPGQRTLLLLSTEDGWPFLAESYGCLVRVSRAKTAHDGL